MLPNGFYKFTVSNVKVCVCVCVCVYVYVCVHLKFVALCGCTVHKIYPPPSLNYWLGLMCNGKSGSQTKEGFRLVYRL